MARIPTARETIRQPAPASPGSQFRGGVVDVSPIARGLASIGQGAERISAQLNQEEQEAKRFKTAADFERFKGEQLRQLTQASRDAEPGAFGLTENALKNFEQNAESFFSELPEEQKAQYRAKLIGFENQFIGAADDVEYKARTTFYRDEIGSQAENLRTRIIDGDISFDEALATGRTLIAESGLSRQEKRQLERGWRKDAAAALWRNEFNSNPLNAVLALGGGTEQQRIDAQRGTLFSAMEKQESGGNPLAISPKGAAGIMQVMPATGAEIAKEIGDANYPTNGSVSEQQAYLQDPEIGRQYGQYYMSKQLDAFDGDVEAALIAYNAGPANAQKWLEAGRDYSVLPKRSETEPYVRNILGGISGTTAVNQYKFGEAMVGAQDMESQFYNWADFRNDRFQDAKVDQAAVNVLDDVTAAFGKGALRITSGFRSQDHNNKASFSTDSRHTHGDAFDIDVSGYNDAEKEQLISLFVASGARGVGHYDNGTIHVDFRSKGGKGPGGLALWYNKNQPYTEGGKWFSEGINQGLASRGVTFARQGPTDARYDVLDYDTRQTLLKEGERKYKEQVAIDRGILAENITETVAFYAATGEGLENQTEIERQIADLYQTDQKAGEQLQRQFRQALEDAELTNRVRTQTPDEIESTVTKLAEAVQRPGNTVRDQQKYANYVGAVNARNEALREDAAGYIQRTNQDLEGLYSRVAGATSPQEAIAAASAYTQRQNEIYDSIGVRGPLRKVLPAGVATQIVGSLEEGEQDVTAQQLQSLLAPWGNRRGQVIQDLERAGLDPEYTVALRHADNPALATEILGLRGEKLSDLKKSVPTISYTEMNEAIFDEAQEYRQVFEIGDLSGQAAQTFNRNFDVAQRLAMTYIRRGEDASAASARAFEQIFPEVVVDEPNVKVIVPNQFTETQVSLGLEAATTEQALRDFAPDPLDDPRLPEFADLEVFIQAAKDGIWLNNSTGDGAVLNIEVGGFFLPVTNKDGDEYEVLFGDITDVRTEAPAAFEQYGGGAVRDSRAATQPATSGGFFSSLFGG